MKPIAPTTKIDTQIAHQHPAKDCLFDYGAALLTFI